MADENSRHDGWDDAFDDQPTPTEQRQDGWGSSRSDIGTAEDAHAHTRFLGGPKLEQEDIDRLYERGRFGRKIVEKPPKDALRPDIEIREDQTSRPFREFRREHNLIETIKEAWISARETGGGALTLITDDDNNLDQPIDWESVTEVEAIHAFNRWDLSVAEYTLDLASNDYRLPRVYNFHPAAVGRARTYKNEQDDTEIAQIHASRIFRFTGARVRPSRLEYYDGWHQPILEALYQVMKDLGICSDATASAAHEFQFAVLKIGKLHELLTEVENGREKFRERLHAMEQSKSIVNAVALDSEKEEELEQKTAAIDQAREAYDILQQNFSYAADMPLSVLFGQMPKGLSTRDESGRQNYFDKVEEKRENILIPAIRFAIKAESYARNSPDLYNQVGVVFGPLDELTAPQGAEVFSQRADGHAKLVEAGIESQDDAEKRMFDDSDSAVPEADIRKPTNERTDAFQVSDQVDLDPEEFRVDKYSGPSDDSLPDEVQDLPEAKRKTWVETFNAVWKDLGEDEDEQKAFRIAWSQVEDS